ncbi:hypothetical protein C8R44DRAFT_585355, partial [Mycena epipterygia]
HASFTDYITNQERCGGRPWFIDSTVYNKSLALQCLQVLKRELQFNICDLKDSRILNTEVTLPKLSERIEEMISPQLAYATKFWADHLHEAGLDQDKDILDELKELMEYRFLYWLEVLSLLEHVSIVTSSLKIALKYV